MSSMMHRLLATFNATCRDQSVHLFMALLTGLSPFLILVTGESSDLDNSVVLRNILHTGPYWRGSSLVSLALVVPLLTDTLINVGAYLWAKRNNQEPANRTKDIHSIMESLLFQGGMLLPPTMAFLPESSRYPTIVQCCFRSHLGLILGVIFASKVRFDSEFCPPSMVMAYYFIAITCNALMPYAQASAVPSRTTILSSSTIAISATVTQYVAIIIIVLALLRSLCRRLWRKFGQYFHASTATKPEVASKPAEPGSVDGVDRESAYLWYRIAYLALALFWIFFSVLSAHRNPYSELRRLSRLRAVPVQHAEHCVPVFLLGLVDSSGAVGRGGVSVFSDRGEEAVRAVHQVCDCYRCVAVLLVPFS